MTTVLDILGAVCLVVAAFLIYLPAGIAVLGVALLLISANLNRIPKKKAATE